MNQNWEEIVWRALRNECSSEELMKLQEWRNETPENEQMYEDVKGIAGMGNFLKGIDSLHKENALENILKRTRQRSLGYARLLKYVAVFLLPLLLGGTLFYFLKFKRQVGEELPVSVAKQILPGGPKAILYLSDGQVIDLNRTIDSVIVDKHSGQEITLSKDINALNYSGVTGNTTQPKELAYNRIEVPRGGEYMLVLSDGTKVWLNSETRLEYPLAFGEYSRDVRLSGEAYFEVMHDSVKPFIVEAAGTRTRVMGTSFNIGAYDDENIVYTTLLSGRVEVSLTGKDGVKPIILNPGEQSLWSKGKGEFTMKKVNTEDVIAWRYGIFVFNEDDIEIVTRVLSRWYGTKFVFDRECTGKHSFSGKMSKDEKLESILKILTLAGGPEFKVEKDIVHVIEK